MTTEYLSNDVQWRMITISLYLLERYKTFLKVPPHGRDHDSMFISILSIKEHKQQTHK